MESKSTLISNLANEYGKQVFTTAFRILGDNHQAEDVTQDVFIKLFKLSLDPIKNWSAYLRTLATSTSLDYLRKRKVRAEDSHLCSQSNDLATSTNHSPSAEFAIHRDLEQLRYALSQIGSQEARVFVLRYIEELSYQEIAEQLAISQSLVGVTLHRGQQKISNLLKESNFLGVNYETDY